jgi:hypothetical protein
MCNLTWPERIQNELVLNNPMLFKMAPTKEEMDRA